jgi:uncharacterized OsmC-like protein
MDDIKAKFESIVEALTADPTLGRGTGTTIARVRDGLACEIESGPWRFVADMPRTSGGSASGPTPGMYGRAALGSCLAIGYAMRAARYGLRLDMVEVEVQADYDDGALFGTADGPAGYSEIRCLVRIRSDAPEVDLLRVLDEADRHSPYLDVFRRAQRCVRTVRITPSSAGS